MKSTKPRLDSVCITPGVQPLLADLQETVRAQCCDHHPAERLILERYIHTVFKQTYGAELSCFYPNLIAYRSAEDLHGVVGFRDGRVKPLFSEQYLDEPVETLIADQVQQTVARRHLVEVGNLALASPGDARWVIAATTMLLHAAGYRWVIFTAVKPLYNAFQRLGLKPIVLAKPDPLRLPDGGRSWGSYYQAGPLVCAGDIEAGYRKLSAHVSTRQPRLHALFNEAKQQGVKARFSAAHDVREAV